MAADGRQAALARAVEVLYTAFERYPHRPSMPVCSHCIEPDDVAALSPPVRALAPAAVEPMAWKALTTWGDVDDFRRVLPRLLHLVAAGHLDVPLAVIASKLVGGDWQSWPSRERAAVAAFLDALWSATLRRWPTTPDVVACVATLDLTVDDLMPYLEEWHALLDADADIRMPALCHLIAAVHRVAAAPGTVRGMLWRGEPDLGSAAALAMWLRGATTAIQLERATFDFAGGPIGEAARGALDRLAGPSASPSP